MVEMTVLVLISPDNLKKLNLDLEISNFKKIESLFEKSRANYDLAKNVSLCTYLEKFCTFVLIFDELNNILFGRNIWLGRKFFK